MRRELTGEVEFLTAMWFDDIDSIKAFVGEDYAISHVPAAARAVLARHDERSTHYLVVDGAHSRPSSPDFNLWPV